MIDYEKFEITGMMETGDFSEIRKLKGPVIDPDFIERMSRAHEEGGYDWVLLGYGSAFPEPTQFAAEVARHTERLGLMIAHRPGVVHPSYASRLFATLDHFSKGRVGLNIVSGGNKIELQREGDYLPREERYPRTEEYLRCLRACWDSRGPHSFEGKYYRFEGFTPPVLPYEDRHLELFFGGSSTDAYGVGARIADTYMLWGEPLKETSEQIAAITQQAELAGRPRPRVNVSFRIVMGNTDEAAWERAHGILDIMNAEVSTAARANQLVPVGEKLENVGSQRLLSVAASGEVHDRCLWTPTSPAISYSGNATTLVGTPETIAASVLDYVELGVNGILIRGYSPLENTIDHGRDLLPLIRQEISHRKATRQPEKSA